MLKSYLSKSSFNIFSFRWLNLVLIYLDDLGKVKLSPITSKNQIIRIGQNSRVRNVVRYCNSLLKEKTYKTQSSDSKEVQNNKLRRF